MRLAWVVRHVKPHHWPPSQSSCKGDVSSCLWRRSCVIGLQPSPKWHPIPYVVHYFWPGSIGNRAPFETKPKSGVFWSTEHVLHRLLIYSWTNVRGCVHNGLRYTITHLKQVLVMFNAQNRYQVLNIILYILLVTVSVPGNTFWTDVFTSPCNPHVPLWPRICCFRTEKC